MHGRDGLAVLRCAVLRKRYCLPSNVCMQTAFATATSIQCSGPARARHYCAQCTTAVKGKCTHTTSAATLPPPRMPRACDRTGDEPAKLRISGWEGVGGSSWQPEVTRPARRLLGLGQCSSAELHATCGSVRATQGRKHRPDGGPTLSGSELDSDAGKRRDQNAET